MTITLDPKVEERLRARAEAAGLTVDRYVENMILEEESPEDELERLLLEGLNSGESIPVDAKFWAERRAEVERRLQARKTR
ncbi:MAG: hypothetical protein FJW38_01405 [Acidobacteria bacterium]|nr:hypothetical protein [Acidobacteriota bacterium]MBM3768717.1 hypothetical protein [Acidobacteriota bacterium]